MLSPSLCHRFVGYLEEEAVHTYSKLIDQLDKGNLPHWTNMPAPAEAIEYYALPSDAKMREFFLAVRADEACHREVNHHFSSLPSYSNIEHSEVVLNEMENKLEINRIEDTPEIDSKK
jgi:hypothetical protein